MTAEGVAEHVLELVRARGSAGVEAEASVERSTEALTRFANSFIHQNVAEESTTVRLRLHLNGRTASGSTTLTSPEGLGALVDRTLDAVRHAPTDPGWPGLAPPAPLAGGGGFDEATAAASPQELAERVRAFVDAAGGLTTAGYCRTIHWSGSFANSSGQAVTARTTDATLDGLVRGADGNHGCDQALSAIESARSLGRCRGSVAANRVGDGVARQAAVRLSDLDGAALGARAAAKARAGADPVQLPPGRYEVVLEPNAVGDLLLHLAMSGFNGKAYAQRRSFLELGEAQLDPSVTIVDDPLAEATPGYAYDAEGTPKQRLVLVDKGVSAAVAHDRRSALLSGVGAVSTGHAAPGSEDHGPVPFNLGLLPTGGDWSASVGKAVDPVAAPLLAGVKRGLLITDLHYTRVLDPKTLVVTGLTRNGVWLVENGEITKPVQNLRFTQSYPQALAPGAVYGIGSAAVLVPTHWGLAWWRAPALHLASWNITGNASG